MSLPTNTAQKIAPEKNAAAHASAVPAPAAAFVIKETKLLGQLHLSRDRLRELRAAFLVQGQHWELLRNRVMLSSAGAELIRANVHATLPEKIAPAAPASNAAQPRTVKALLADPTPFAGVLIAWRAPRINTRLLVAYRPGTDPSNPLNLVSVRVASNLHFMTGDEFPAQQVSVNVFNLIGPCPRYRGEFKRKQQKSKRPE